MFLNEDKDEYDPRFLLSKNNNLLFKKKMKRINYTRLSLRFNSSTCMVWIWSGICVIWFDDRSSNCKFGNLSTTSGIFVKRLFDKVKCLKPLKWANDNGNE